MPYFKKLPIIEYNGFFCRNLSTRVSIDGSTVNYHPYSLKDQDRRPDIIAKNYYDGYDYDWLVLLSNNVLDPYYDMGLTQVNFDSFIKKKYTSQENAEEEILYYRNNWRSDDTVLSIASYNSLPANQKEYYKEKIDYRGNISGYERKRDDWKVSTNKIISLGVTAHSYEHGDKIKQGSAEGYVDSANTTHLTLVKISGAFVENTVLSNTSINVTSVTTISNVIPSGEEVYWEAITAYEDEFENNEAKRKIRLVDNRYKNRIEKQIEDILS